MFSRILVPLDLSDRNEIAVETAAELALASGGSILLLHVIEELEDGPTEELEAFYSGLRRRAESTLGAVRARLERKEITVEERIRMGRRGPEVVRCAEEERCDLVVLRSHVLDRGESMRAIGTVSHQVALAASCAVMLVR